LLINKRRHPVGCLFLLICKFTYEQTALESPVNHFHRSEATHESVWIGEFGP